MIRTVYQLHCACALFPCVIPKQLNELLSSGDFLEKLIFTQLFDKFTASYETRKLLSMFETSRHWTVSGWRLNQSTSHLF